MASIACGIPVPIIGDFHYNGHILLKKYPDCARALAKYRINPGNVGVGKKHDDNFRTMIEVAIENDKPVRIGVNWGSLDQALLTRLMDENSKLAEPKDARDVIMEAMVQSALRSAELAGRSWLAPGPDHPQRQGQRRAGSHRRLSRAGAPLRLSPASRPDRGRHGRKGYRRQHGGAGGAAAGRHRRHHSRVADARHPTAIARKRSLVAQQILQSIGIRSFTPQVTACPGCGRTTSTFFQEMAEQIQSYLRDQMPVWKTRYAGVEEMKVAVMGCVVNGPGESKHANIGISLPGTVEEPKAPVYVDGRLMTTLKGDHIVAEFIKILDDYVDSHYATKPQLAVSN